MRHVCNKERHNLYSSFHITNIIKARKDEV